MLSVTDESSPLIVNGDGKPSLQRPVLSPDAASTQSGLTGYRTYRWRWVVLAIFMLNVGSNNALWITFAPIANVMRCYYGISNLLVNVLSVVSAVLTILLMVPGAWCLGRYGLRFTVVLASVGNALGAAIRVAGSGSGYYWLLMVGQTVMSFNALMLPGSALLSEVWFPASQRATATALAAAVAPQLGVLVGFSSPTVIHRDDTSEVCGNSTYLPTVSPALFSDWRSTISDQIFYTLLVQAAVCVAILGCTVLGFYEAPPTAPSFSRKLESKQRDFMSAEPLMLHLKHFCVALFQVLKNRHYVLYLLAAAINIGAAGAITSLVNEIIQPHFPQHDREIGYIGIIHTVMSILTMVVVGRLLDWTKAFYKLSVAFYILIALSTAGLIATVLFQKHFYPLYVTYPFVGICIAGFQAVASEYAVEMTYPIPEGVSLGLLNINTMSVATVFTLVVGQLVQSSHSVAVYAGTWLIPAALTVGAVLIVFVRPELKRVEIDRETSTDKSLPRHRT